MCYDNRTFSRGKTFLFYVVNLIHKKVLLHITKLKLFFVLIVLAFFAYYILLLEIIISVLFFFSE